MESSRSSSNVVPPPQHRWVKITGTAIALLTLALPPLVISYYSSGSNSPDPLPPTTYSMPQRQ